MIEPKNTGMIHNYAVYFKPGKMFNGLGDSENFAAYPKLLQRGDLVIVDHKSGKQSYQKVLKVIETKGRGDFGELYQRFILRPIAYCNEIDVYSIK